MARYSGGPVTHRALTGPRLRSEDEGWNNEVLYTLNCIREIRTGIERTELNTVRHARRAGFSWTEIAVALGVDRDDVSAKWAEVDEAPPEA